MSKSLNGEPESEPEHVVQLVRFIEVLEYCKDRTRQPRKCLARLIDIRTLSKLIRNRQEMSTLISTHLAHIPARSISRTRHWSDVFVPPETIRDHHYDQQAYENCGRYVEVCRCDWQSRWSEREDEAVDRKQLEEEP